MLLLLLLTCTQFPIYVPQTPNNCQMISLSTTINGIHRPQRSKLWFFLYFFQPVFISSFLMLFYSCTEFVICGCVLTLQLFSSDKSKGLPTKSQDLDQTSSSPKCVPKNQTRFIIPENTMIWFRKTGNGRSLVAQYMRDGLPTTMMHFTTYLVNPTKSFYDQHRVGIMFLGY